ncbi:hypothetical protein H696_00197 [Fonticula alba]|uniref:Uncharacterized protein n=1 Tax=Fonticula alba TaxID=691883 RepID=A0A058ZFA2_FONAL|nr:hypothetical protein H696_00197 [Fonticula alba]KCV72613.1 hypothetical protein H696_00197 [Fonticula alba]|eukprot:XP_009492314.1 hypothetical protein H696_00197 [Fonticula alba]
MRLLAHNLMCSHVRGVKNGYPLGLAATEVRFLDEVAEKAIAEQMAEDSDASDGEYGLPEYNDDVMANIWPKVVYSVLHQAASALGHAEGLPPPKVAVSPSMGVDAATVASSSNPDLASLTEQERKTIYRILFYLDVVEGSLTCPESGRVFPIVKSIPNMLLDEDEV